MVIAWVQLFVRLKLPSEGFEREQKARRSQRRNKIQFVFVQSMLLRLKMNASVISYMKDGNASRRMLVNRMF